MGLFPLFARKIMAFHGVFCTIEMQLFCFWNNLSLVRRIMRVVFVKRYYVAQFVNIRSKIISKCFFAYYFLNPIALAVVSFILRYEANKARNYLRALFCSMVKMGLLS